MADDVDWSHTPKAERDRTVKAHQLANAARALGTGPEHLVVGCTEQRRAVRELAGMPRKVSEETWHATCVLLTDQTPADRVTPRPVRTRPCVRCGATPARLFMCGWRCHECTPAALAGRPEPAAPAPTPRTGHLTSRTAAVLAVEQDARLQAAKRNARTAADRARIGEHAHRLYGHLANQPVP